MGSPPPVAECRNAITSTADPTVGWGNSLSAAWVLVLKVLGLGEDGQPRRNAATPVLHEVPEVTAGGGGPLVVAPPDTGESPIPGDMPFRKRMQPFVEQMEQQKLQP